MDIYLTTPKNVMDTVEFAFGLKFHLSRVAFSLFGYDIYWYAILIVLGMSLALIFGFKKAKSFGINPDKLFDCIIVGMIGAFVCARAYYVIFAPESIKETYDSFMDVINVRDGGLAIYGGIIGAVLFGGITAKIRKLKLSPVLDLAALGFLIGQGVGRWGNFFNSEAYGEATTLPWGMTSATIQSEMGLGEFVHPTFLYESIWCILVFIVLLVYSKHRKFDGELFLMYIGLYGLERFFVEGLRTDSLMLGKVRVSQLVAGLCVLVAVIAIILIRSKVKRNEEYLLYVDTEVSKADILNYEQSLKKNKKTETVEETVEEIEETEVLVEKTDETEV